MWDLYDLFAKFKNRFVPKYGAVTYMSLDDDLNFYVGDDEVDSILLVEEDNFYGNHTLDYNKNNITLKVTVTDENNDLLEGVPITFYVNGNYLGSSISDENGIAEYVILKWENLGFRWYSNDALNIEEEHYNIFEGDLNIVAKYSNEVSNSITLKIVPVLKILDEPIDLSDYISSNYVEDYSALELMFGKKDGNGNYDNSNLWDSIVGGNGGTRTITPLEYNSNTGGSIELITGGSSGNITSRLQNEFTQNTNYILSVDYESNRCEKHEFGFGDYTGESIGRVKLYFGICGGYPPQTLFYDKFGFSSFLNCNLFGDVQKHNFKLIRLDNVLNIVIDGKYIIYNLDVTDVKNYIGLTTYEKVNSHITLDNVHLYLPKN